MATWAYGNIWSNMSEDTMIVASWDKPVLPYHHGQNDSSFLGIQLVIKVMFFGYCVKKTSYITLHSFNDQQKV